MTSNAGISSRGAGRKPGFKAGALEDERENEDIKDEILSEIKHVFRPEFLNRIDDVIVFRQLNDQDMQAVVSLLVDELAERCADMNIRIQVEDTVKQYLVKKHVNIEYGARPLRRAVQSELEDTIAEEILKGEIKPGDDVDIRMKENEIMIKSRIVTVK